MSGYEYRVVPAPAKGQKAKGLKTPEERFSHTLEELMNRMGAEGWEYQRAETLPSTERAGLTGTTTNWRHVLVFRRARDQADAVFKPKEQRIVGPLISPPRAPANDPQPHAAAAAERAVPPLRAKDAGESDPPSLDAQRDTLAKSLRNPEKSDV